MWKKLKRDLSHIITLYSVSNKPMVRKIVLGI